MLITIATLGIVGLQAAYTEHVHNTTDTSVYTFTLTVPVAESIPSFYGDFPPSLGIALDEFGIKNFGLTLTRGRTGDDAGPPPGAVLEVVFDGRYDKRDSYKRLTQSITAIAGPLSIDEELAGTSPLVPVDVDVQRRLFHAPHATACTGNLRAMLDLLPCGSTTGLGLFLMGQWKFLADSRYFRLRLFAEKTQNAEYHMRLTIETAGHMAGSVADFACPVATRSSSSDEDVLAKNKPRLVSKKMRGYAMTHGTLVYRVGHRTENLVIVDLVPFFVTPLLHTLNTTCPLEWAIERPTDRLNPKQGTVLRLTVAPGDACQVEIDTLKNFVHISLFNYAADKGFDVAGAFYKEESETHWSTTNGIVVNWPMQDGSMTYNAVAISTAVIFFFYGKVAKEFFPSKPSIIKRLLLKLGLTS